MVRIGLGEFNCYLVLARDGFVLVATGRPEKRAMLDAALGRAGCRPGDLGLIVITHGDCDHAGNAAYLRDTFGARIAMHREDVARMELGDWRVGFEPKPDRVSWIFKEVSRRISVGDFEVFEPDIYLEDGQSLAEHGFDATVLRLFGQAGGSLAILAQEDATARDARGGGAGGPDSHLFVADLAAAKADLDRLLSLGVQMVYPAFGRPLPLERLRDLHV
ncbi:MAG: MBL fold metallo-hydrolase [Thermoleophilia bacterium]|nr:MBL fold metallo-hydrolase [Thermoleophilia bacterium]